MTKLFLDDLRTPDMIYTGSKASEFKVVRRYAEFKKHVEENGLPDFISFDNDLGLDENGEVAPDGYAAAEQIRGFGNNYIGFLKKFQNLNCFLESGI